MEENARQIAGSVSGAMPTASDVALTSLSISLKRIADAMVGSRLGEIANTVAKISDNVTAIERDR